MTATAPAADPGDGIGDGEYHRRRVYEAERFVDARPEDLKDNVFVTGRDIQDLQISVRGLGLLTSRSEDVLREIRADIRALLDATKALASAADELVRAAKAT